MKKIHLIFGILVVLAFLMTGQYMDKYHNHLVGVPTTAVSAPAKARCE